MKYLLWYKIEKLEHYNNTRLKLIYSINIILIALIIIKLYDKLFKIILILKKFIII